jgi:hypothetical protein
VISPTRIDEALAPAAAHGWAPTALCLATAHVLGDASAGDHKTDMSSPRRAAAVHDPRLWLREELKVRHQALFQFYFQKKQHFSYITAYYMVFAHAETCRFVPKTIPALHCELSIFLKL